MDAFLIRLTVEQRGFLANICPSCGHCELLANGRFSHGNISENMRKSTFSAAKRFKTIHRVCFLPSEAWGLCLVITFTNEPC